MKKKLYQGLPWICLIAAFCASISYIAIYGNNYLDSDQAAELILANLLKEEGGILSKNWTYGSSLRVFEIQLFLKAGLILSPHNWHMARVIGQALVLLALVVAYLFAATSFSSRRASVYTAAALCCPFGYWYEFHVIMLGFYTPYMILILFGMGAFVRIFSRFERGKITNGVKESILNDKVKLALLLAVTVIVAFVSGLGGVRILMNFYAPLMVAILFMIFWKVREGGVNKIQEERRYKDIIYMAEVQILICGIISAIAYMAGLAINLFYFSKVYAFVNQSGSEWSYFTLGNLLQAWSMLLGDFGYPVDLSEKNVIQVFSLSGILGLLGMLTAGFLLFSLWRLGRRFFALEKKQQFVYLIGICTFVVVGFIFAVLPYQASNGSYWLPNLPIFFALMQLEIETEDFRLKCGRALTAVVLGICIAGTSIANTHQAITEPLRAKPGLRNVALWLEENGYTQGFAEFWDSNVINVWTNGNVEMWTVMGVKSLEIMPWLQRSEHGWTPEGEVFVLIEREEKTIEDRLAELPYGSCEDVQMVYGDDEYIVLSCEDAGILYNCIK